MTLKKNFKQYLTHPVKRIGILYASSKHVFLVMAFLFFLSYFCISAGFYDQYFIPVFLPLYVAFILSLIIFLTMGTFKFGASKIPKILLGLISLIWIGLGIFFLIPVL